MACSERREERGEEEMKKRNNSRRGRKKKNKKIKSGSVAKKRAYLKQATHPPRLPSLPGREFLRG